MVAGTPQSTVAETCGVASSHLGRSQNRELRPEPMGLLPSRPASSHQFCHLGPKGFRANITTNWGTRSPTMSLRKTFHSHPNSWQKGKAVEQSSKDLQMHEPVGTFYIHSEYNNTKSGLYHTTPV